MTSLDELQINLCLPLAAKTYLMTSYLVILTVKVGGFLPESDVTFLI